MPSLKRLVNEVHRRSLWQVLGAYLAGAWVGYEIVQSLTEGLALPNWFPAFAVALFIILLPLVLATAFVQEGVDPRINRRTLWLVLGVYLLSAWIAYHAIRALTDKLSLPGWVPGLAGALFILLVPIVLWATFVRETAEVEATVVEPAGAGMVAPAPGRRDEPGARRFFTWRNLAVAGVSLFAVLGVVGVGWVLFAFPGLVLRAEAADFFSANDRVVVSEFDNETDEAALALAVREAILTDLDGSPYLRVVDRSELREVIERMRLEADVRLDADIALEIARREGYPAVVAGGVAPLGSGYQLTARILEASTGVAAVRLRETAASEGEVLGAVERLVRLVRRHLGESLGSLRRAPPLPSVTTESLEALELYSRARELALSGNQLEAIPLGVQATEIDSGFAAAHRVLGIWYSNVGDPVAGQPHVDMAHRFGQRLIPRERYMTGALFHAYRGRLDSAAYYYGLAVERYPDLTAAINNLGDVYERMGRYEDARALYQRAVAQRESAINLLNLASAERTLGRHAAADSALERLTEAFPNTWITWSTRAMNPYYAGDFDRVEEVARGMAESEWPFPRAYGRWLQASVSAMHGRAEAALAVADTSADQAIEFGSRPFPYEALRVAVYAALAAGAPERALPLLEKLGPPQDLGAAPIFEYWALGYVANGYAVAGDLPRARTILTRMDSLALALDLSPPGIGDQVRAVIALQENRPQASLEHLRRARSREHGNLNYPSRLFLADTYAALGQMHSAAAQYDSLTRTYGLNFRDPGTYGPLRPLAHERAGSAYLAHGDTAAALRHLSTFVELWSQADPELQPRVEGAQRTIEALSRDR